MILEVAVLDIRPESREIFEVAFPKAARIVSAAKGYISHQLQRSLDNPNRFVLLVQWQTKEDHVVGFRGSPQYQEWRKALHHYLAIAPNVEHYQLIQGAGHDSPA
jgi:heme-degrading monooxygenase HmoA